MTTLTMSPKKGTKGGKTEVKQEEKEEAVFFKEERKGWHGYVEWEKYPERKEEGAKILAKHKFPDVCFCEQIPE